MRGQGKSQGDDRAGTASATILLQRLVEQRERLVADEPLAILFGDVLGGARAYALVEILTVALSDEYPTTMRTTNSTPIPSFHEHYS
jgi:hypothetical protein